MNRPVIGTLCVLALLALGLYLGWTYKDHSDQDRGNWSGPAARSAIQASLDVVLPPTAGEVHCYEEDAGHARRLYATFDLPPAELPTLLYQRQMFPEVGQLKTDPSLVSTMLAQADPLKRPWWRLEPLPADTVAGEKSGRRTGAPAAIKWRVQVCAAPLSPQATRVLVLLSEESESGG
jgi:hypothetical protein